jgi:WD40 repeat protein
VARLTAWTRSAATGSGGICNAVTFSPDGNTLINIGPDYTAQVWDVSLFADPYTALCAQAGPPARQVWNQYASGEPLPKVCS